VTLVIGFTAGMISTIGFSILNEKCMSKGLFDTCGVQFLHGIPGVYGGIISAIIAATVETSNFGNSVYKLYPKRLSDNGNYSAHW